MIKFTVFYVAVGLVISVALSGCVSMQESTPIPSEKVLKAGLVVSQKMPQTIPSDAHVTPDTHFAVLFAENAAKLLMPVPFVADAVEDSVNNNRSEAYREHYLGINIVDLARNALATSSLKSEKTGAL